MEDLRSQFKVFGEALSLTREQMERRFNIIDERFDKVDERFDKVDERFGKVDERFDRMDERFGKVDERFDKIETDLEMVKSELGIIRHNQITRDEFKLLEVRVLRLEKALVGRSSPD